MKLPPFLIALLMTTLCFGQGMKSMRCPKAKKEKAQRTGPAAYLDISAGSMLSFMYRNSAGTVPGNYRFTSRPGVYVSIAEHVALTDRLELVAGVELTESIQGLRFAVNDGGNAISEANYNGSLLLRVPVGLNYWIKPAWSISVCPMFVYNNYWSNNLNASYSGSSAGSSSLRSDLWEDMDYTKKIYAGLGVSSRFRLARRFALSLMWSMDFETSVRTASSISSTNGATTNTFQAVVEPYLMYGGLTLNFVLWEQGKSR